jgi:hypothetical protein
MSGDFMNDLELPQPYLIFMGDVVLAPFAKTASVCGIGRPSAVSASMG